VAAETRRFRSHCAGECPGAMKEARMESEQRDIDTDPPMPPEPMRDRDAEVDEDIRRPDGEPPVPPVPMRDRDAERED
jgi:hypothetical protein